MMELLIRLYIAGVISGILLSSFIVILFFLIKWKIEEVRDGN